MDDLYQQYGKLMIQQEILQGQIQEVKAKIVIRTGRGRSNHGGVRRLGE